MNETEHRSVLEALRDAISQIEHLHRMFRNTEPGEAAIAKLKAAIQIMEAN